jgi:competence protein ComFA
VADFFFLEVLMKKCPISIHKQLAGRCLLWDEIKQILSNWELGEFLSVVKELELQGLVQKQPAVRQSSWAIHRKCNRCGAGFSYIESSHCASCGSQKCAYCTKCLFQGRAKTCKSIFSFTPVPLKGEYEIESTYPLLYAQGNTLTKLKRMFEEKRKHINTVFIPGSGEMLIIICFLEYLLSQNKRVFWCQERQHITKTMDYLSFIHPRLFKHIEDKFDSSIVLGTSWDLLTYYQQFDVVIWDRIQTKLFGSEQRALIADTQEVTIHTTFPGWFREIDIVHPVRLHRYPLPIPIFIQQHGLRKKLQNSKPIIPIQQFLNEVTSLNGQAFILVPTKEDVEATMTWIKKRMPEWADKVGSIYEEDEDAERVRILFLDQKFTFLIMPQKLAKSMKVANLHLCLLHADHPSLDRKRLVELSHFIGLNAYFPKCEIWFIAEWNTEMIIQTKKEHNYLNQLAEKEGYLQKEA